MEPKVVKNIDKKDKKITSEDFDQLKEQSMEHKVEKIIDKKDKKITLEHFDQLNYLLTVKSYY